MKLEEEVEQKNKRIIEVEKSHGNGRRAIETKMYYEQFHSKTKAN